MSKPDINNVDKVPEDSSDSVPDANEIHAKTVDKCPDKDVSVNVSNGYDGKPEVTIKTSEPSNTSRSANVKKDNSDAVIGLIVGGILGLLAGAALAIKAGKDD